MIRRIRAINNMAIIRTPLIEQTPVVDLSGTEEESSLNIGTKLNVSTYTIDEDVTQTDNISYALNCDDEFEEFENRILEYIKKSNEKEINSIFDL